MGMLSGFVKGIAGGVADVATRRSKELRDDELIAKREEMDLAREQRIQEAQAKNHTQERGERLDDYAMQRTDKLSDYAMQREDGRQDSADKFERDKALNAEVRAESRLEREDIRRQKQEEDDDPSSYKSQYKAAQIESQTLKNEALRQKKYDADKQRLSDLDDIVNTWNTDDRKKSDFAPGEYEKELSATKAAKVEADRLRKSLETPVDTKAEGTGMLSKPTGEQAGNNIGNIRNGKDGAFGASQGVEGDVNAIVDNLKAYKSKHGIDTLESAISRWSPPNENDTARLIADASKLTGLDPKAKIDLDNPEIQKALTFAIVKQEGAVKGGDKMNEVRAAIAKIGSDKSTITKSRTFVRDENGNIIPRG